MSPLAWASEATLSASVDRSQVFVGERFTLSLRFSGTRAIDAPDLRFAGLRVNYIGPMTRMESVGGRVNTSITHRYALSALKPGSYKLGPFRIAHQGSVLESPALNIEVISPDSSTASTTASQQQDLRLRLLVEPEKKSVFIGERVALKIRLLVADVRVDDLNYPEIGGEGFAIEDISRPTQQSEIVNGKRVQSLEFRTTLTPLRAGRLEIGPVTMSMDLLETHSRRSGDPLFDRFLGVTRRKPVKISASAVSLQVQPLPTQGRPEDFSGAIGRFAFSVSASPTEVAAGDPVAVHMEIAGRGNLTSIKPPRVAVDGRFRAYEPLPAELSGNAGGQAFEQVIIPRSADIAELPAVRFSYFDPAAKAYRSITRGPIPLRVRASTGHSAPAVIVVDEQAAAADLEEPLGRDIVYIKERPGRLLTPASNGSSDFGFWTAQALAPCIFAFALYYRRRRERIGADPRLARYHRSGKQIRAALKRLRAESGGQAEQFYDVLTAAFRDYMAAKLDLPPGAVECERVSRQLRDSGIDTAVCEKVSALFAHMETARYTAGARSNHGHETALALTEEIVTALERSRVLSHRLGLLVVTMLLLSASTVLVAGVSDDDPMALFFLGNRAYAEADYSSAAQFYQRIIEGGHYSGAVYFNLGNTRFKLHQTGSAIANYERARRLLPRDPDVAANLGYAREEAKIEAPPVALIQRLIAPLATRATSNELLAATLGLWWLAWIALTVAKSLDRGSRPAWRLGLSALLLCALTTLNLGLRWSQVEGLGQAVVVVDELSVRYEPNHKGTEHYRLAEGTMVEVRSEREDWLQVRRHDGLRGWVPKSALELL